MEPWGASGEPDDHGAPFWPSPKLPLHEVNMLYTLAVILLVMWLLGMISAYTLGGFIHLLLVLAIVLVLLRVLQGPQPI